MADLVYAPGEAGDPRLAGDGDFTGLRIPWSGRRFYSLLCAGILAGALIVNSLDLLTTWHLYSRIGGQEANLLQSLILERYGFTALAIYKGWAMSLLLVGLYACSTRDWRWRGLALLVFASITLLLCGVVIWNGMQILSVAGMRL